jgi:uncharacterized protein YaeQ
VYKACIELSDVDRGVYETLQATVAQHPSETEERLVARLLAYAIFYEPELAFTKGICATDEPDLWLKGGDGRVRLWVEVGLPEADRIIKAARHAERVALLACGRALAGWDKQHLPRLEKLDNLSVISIDQALIAGLAARLQRAVNWSITITEGTCFLTVAEESMEAALQAKTGNR